jgi:hypothetical protein
VTQAKYGILVPPGTPSAMTEALNELSAEKLANLRVRASEGSKRYGNMDPVQRYWKEITGIL